MEKIDFNQLLATTPYGKLSDSQMLTACDAGFTDEELEGKNYPWYQDNRHLMTYKRGKNAPALPKQIEYLATVTNIDPKLKYMYHQLKAAIRAYAVQFKRQKYIDCIANVNETEANRKAESRQKIAEEKNATVFDEADKMNENNTVSDEEFFKSFKKAKVPQ